MGVGTRLMVVRTRPHHPRRYVSPPGWTAKRLRQLARQPGCQWVGVHGERCPAWATDVDHVVPMSRGGADSPENYQSLCHSHHASKTALEFGFGERARRRSPTRHAL